MAKLIRLKERHRLRVGVIGCGNWGINHVCTLHGLHVLAAIADRDTRKTARIAKEFGCAGLSPDALIADQDIEAVVVALPAERHVEMALQVIEAGKHLLVEKPMALDLEGAEAIVRSAGRRGVVAMTGHVLRFHPAFEALEHMIEEGALGTVRYIYSTRLGLGRFFAGTDALWDIAPHDLSLLLAILGHEPTTVHLEGAAIVTDAPDFAHLHMMFPSGARSHTFISRLVPNRDRRFTVIGDKAMAVFDDLQPWDRKLALFNYRVWNEAGDIRYESTTPEFVETSQKLPLTSELEHFLNCAQNGIAPRASVAEGLAVLRVLSAVEPQKGRMNRMAGSTVQAGG